MFFTFMSSCTKKNNTTESKPVESGKNQEEVADGEEKDAKQEEENTLSNLSRHVHFDDLFYDKPAYAEAYGNYVSEHLGREFVLEAVPTDARWEKLNTKMMSGDYPDTTELKEAAFDFALYVQQGHVIPITDFLKNSEKLNYLLEKHSSVFDRYTINGEIYAIPQSDYNLKVMWIRKDWLDNLGLEMPQTTDDLYKVLKAFTYDDPDQNGKDDTVGMINPKYVHDFFPVFYAFGADYLFKEDENGKIYDGFTQPEMKDALDYLKKLMDEGLLDKEWVTMSNSMQREMSYSGYNGVVIHWDANGHDYNVKTQEGDPNANWQMVPTVMGPGGNQGVFENGLGNPWAITKGCDNPEQAFEFFEFIFGTEEGTMLHSFGPPYYSFSEPDDEISWDVKDGQYVRTESGEERGEATAFSPTLFQAGVFECPIKGDVSPYVQEWIDIRPTLNELTVIQPAIGVEDDWYGGVAGLIKEKKEELITKYLFGELDIDEMYEEWDDWWDSIKGPTNLERLNSERN